MQPPQSRSTELSSPKQLDGVDQIFYAEVVSPGNDSPKSRTPRQPVRQQQRTGEWDESNAGSRQDVAVLEDWLSEELLRVAEDSNTPAKASPIDASHNDYSRRAGVVRKQLKVLAIGFNEVVSQVSTHCAQRGVLLKRIWHSHWELVDWVISEMNSTLSAANTRLAGTKDENQAHRVQLQQLSEQHAQEMADFEAQQSRQWRKRMQDFEELLEQREKLLKTCEGRYAKALSWFPNLQYYSDSVLVNLLTTPSDSETAERHKTFTKDPQAAIQADLKSLVDSGVVPLDPGIGEQTASTPSKIQRQMRIRMDKLDAQLRKASALLIEAQEKADESVAQSKAREAVTQEELVKAQARIQYLEQSLGIEKAQVSTEAQDEQPQLGTDMGTTDVSSETLD